MRKSTPSSEQSLKSELRRRKKLETAALSNEYIRESDAAIEKKLLSMPEYTAAQSVFCYYSVGREAATHGIMRQTLAYGKALALPVTLPGGEMYFARVSSLDELTAGIFGIPEPIGEPATPEPGDIIIVPALCADLEGNRIGHGAGYYDRYLGKTDCFSACLCRRALLEEHVPTEETDVRVSAVLTD